MEGSYDAEEAACSLVGGASGPVVKKTKLAVVRFADRPDRRRIGNNLASDGSC